MAIDPEPAPTSHRQFARSRRQRRERQRAHLALGELAVVLEPVVGQARARAAGSSPTTSATSSAIVLSGSMSRKLEAPRGAERRRSRGPPIASSTVDRESPKPALAQQRSQSRRRLAVPRQREHARARLQMRNDAARARGHAARAARNPATPSRAATPRELNAEGCGKHTNLVGADDLGEQRADAEEERIAAREHADVLPAPRQNRRKRVLQRRRPRQALAGGLADQLQMACAADDQRGLRMSRALAAGETATPSSPRPIKREPARRSSRAAPETNRMRLLVARRH